MLLTSYGISKRHADRMILDGIDFSIKEGEIVGLLGPNGAGKTTLLRALMGLTSADGEVSILGEQDRPVSDVMQQVCFLSDVASLPRWMTIQQLIQLWEGVYPQFQRESLDEFLDESKMKRTHKLSQLSRGEITQLYLHGILSMNSRLLILDEPTLGLDLINRNAFYDVLLHGFYRKDRAVIIATHQLAEVERLLTRLVIINQGRILLDSPLEQMIETFYRVDVTGGQEEALQALGPICRWQTPRHQIFLFEGVEKEALLPYGQVQPAALEDIFIAKVREALQ